MNSASRVLRVETPEGIWFTMELATPLARSLALGVDTAVVIGLGSAGGQLASMAGLFDLDFSRAAGMLLLFGLWIGYSLVLEWWWRGRTIGKRLLGLQVMDSKGLRLHPSQIVLRNLLRFFDALPVFYLVGGVCALFNRMSQRLGDIAANTVVIRHRRPVEPDFEGLFSGRYNSLKEHPVLAARLRAKVSAEAAAIALRALMEREHYEPRARLELFAEIARYFRSMQQFPDSALALEEVSDEVFVRNVVEVVCRSGSG